MPNQISSFDAPKIDSYAAERLLSQRFLANIVQGLIWQNGLGVSEEYSAQANSAEIRVVKHNRQDAFSRTLGALGQTNNAHFNTDDAREPSTEEYGIRPVHVYDWNHDLATVMSDMISLNVINAEAEEIENIVRELINSFTLATMVASTLNYDYTDSKGIIKFDEDNEKLLSKISEAHAYLDEGDADHGIATFPDWGRIGVFTPHAKHLLRNVENGVDELGSSRAVQLMEIGSAGGLEPGRLNTEVNGYFGTVYNMPAHMMTMNIIKFAEEYLDVDANLLKDNLYGVINHTIGFGRALATPERQKIIDNPRGHGLRIQPLVRWGGTVFYPRSVVLIMDDGFNNPVISTATKLEVIGSKSRT